MPTDQQGATNWDRARQERERMGDGRNWADPRGERRWPATKTVASMPSVASSGVSGPTRTMHPLSVRNPAKFSRKMSISDAGTGGHGDIPIHWPTKPSLIGGVVDRLPSLLAWVNEVRRAFRGGY